MYPNYLAVGGPNPLNPKTCTGQGVGSSIWCSIYRVAGQCPMHHYYLFQKYVKTPKQLFCNFFQSIGHNESKCHKYALMMEDTTSYNMQVEIHAQENQGSPAGHGRFEGERHGQGGGAGWGQGQIIYYNSSEVGHFARDYENPTCLSCNYCIKFNHVIEYCLVLMAKMQENKNQQPL